jgi:hypothetical protein
LIESTDSTIATRRPDGEAVGNLTVQRRHHHSMARRSRNNLSDTEEHTSADRTAALEHRGVAR